jgi:glycosyltransferase involved in cell wall biosynthesis
MDLAFESFEVFEGRSSMSSAAHHPKSIHLCLLGDANSVHVQRWCLQMLQRGFRVSLITARPNVLTPACSAPTPREGELLPWDGPATVAQPLEGVTQYVLKPVSRTTDWLWRVRQTRAFLDEIQPDIVHAHYITSYGYLAARCRRAGQPLVMTAWGSDVLVSPRQSRLINWLTGWVLRQADLITGDSHDLLGAIRAYQPRGRCELIHWGADLERFRPAPWAGKTGFQIVSLRAWEPNYRIDVIVEAVAQLIERRPDWRVSLHLLGGGTLEAALRTQVAALGLSRDQVKFHGRVGDAAMVAAMDACKVSVSIPISDATSVSVLESMACGLAVVASDLPANRHWLDPSMLQANSSAAQLADLLEKLAADEQRAEQIGGQNLQRMQLEGARAVQMDAMAKLYGVMAL